MNKHLYTILFFLFLIQLAFGQGFREAYSNPQQSQLMGGLGMTWIDDQPYTTLTIAPEFALGKIGVGFYLQLLLDNQNNWKLRKDEYESGAGWLRAIRYVRYGNKLDPFYARFGTLALASLGNGFLMWNYTNASNYDQRKWGLAFDIDFGKFGFESVTNNLGRLELIGGNLYFRPFRFITGDTPILKSIRIYGTYVYDDRIPSWENPGEYRKFNAYGLGSDLIFINTPIFKSGIYYDFAKFQDFGNGQAAGINFIFPELLGVFTLVSKFERRWTGEKFIPNFFGPLYELDRELSPFDYPLESIYGKLENAGQNQGYFGELAGHILGKVRLAGNYQRLDDLKYSGIMHIEALAPDLVPKFEFRAYYDKRGIESFRDVRTLDNKSLAVVDVGYRLNRFLLLSTVYYWYWVEVLNPETGLVEYRPLERIEPRLSFSYRF